MRVLLWAAIVGLIAASLAAHTIWLLLAALAFGAVGTIFGVFDDGPLGRRSE